MSTTTNAQTDTQASIFLSLLSFSILDLWSAVAAAGF
ncbi:hypothetical protein [Sporisorium scitamineum]|uniref:Uncharacterized protein n=1 Tax=Sporisorium scitamineum TaxID=49012 RepID=A0A0F7SDJ6_9BASI|nr:hypothetical protein [Sporisorium scitamineum]